VLLLFSNTIIANIVTGCVLWILITVICIIIIPIIIKIIFKYKNWNIIVFYSSLCILFICICFFISFKISSGDYFCKINKSANGVIIYKYKGKNTEIIIPDKIFNLPVIGIRESAFANKNITEIFIPKSIKYIENNAFIGNMLKNISIGDNVDIHRLSFSNEINGFVPDGSKWVEVLNRENDNNDPRFPGRGSGVMHSNDIWGSFNIYEWYTLSFISFDFSQQYIENNKKGGIYYIEWILKPEQPDLSFFAARQNRLRNEYLNRHHQKQQERTISPRINIPGVP